MTETTEMQITQNDQETITHPLAQDDQERVIHSVNEERPKSESNTSVVPAVSQLESRADNMLDGPSQSELKDGLEGENQHEPATQETAQRQCQCGEIDGVCHCDFKRVKEQTLIYAVGELKVVFPNAGLEQAFNTAARALTVSEYNYYKVFSYVDTKTNTRPYLYIAEQIDWVLRIDNEDCYVLVPRSKTELFDFIDALKNPKNSLQDVHATAVGILGENTTTVEGILPSVLCNHLYSQTLDELHEKLKGEKGVTLSAIQTVLKQLEFSPNHGNTNFSRATNYLVFRYPDIYLTTQSLQDKSSPLLSTYFLDDIQPNYSDLMSPHTLVDMVLTYKNKSSKEKKYYHCSVDVTRQYPFVNTPLRPFMPVKLMGE